MSSLECTSRKQVCAPASPPRFPPTVTQACQDCSTNNDCPMGDECRAGVCVDICGPRICGDVNGVSCGQCPAGAPGDTPYCLAPGLTCLSTVASSPGFSGNDSLAFVSGALMWTDRLGGSVYALRLSDGMLDEIASSENYPDGVGATSTTYYWGGQGGVFQRARGGGNRTLAAAFTNTTERCISLAIAPGQISCGVYSSVVGGEGVYRAPLGGGGTMTRVVQEPYPSVLNRGQNVFFLGGSRLGFHDAIANTTTPLLTHNGFAKEPLFADDAVVHYWRDDTGNAVKRLDLSTRVEATFATLAQDEVSVRAGASDGVHVYLLVETGGNGLRLRKVNIATSASSVLADDVTFGGISTIAMQLEANALLLGFPGYVLRVAPR